MTDAVPRPRPIQMQSRRSPASVPFVYEEGTTASLHFEIEGVQSRMDKEHPDRLMLTYTQIMMGFLLLNDSPRHIGMIGLGGGSLPKYCHRHLPKTRMSVAEISPDVIALRGYFQIPEDDDRFKVILEDGAEFVSRMPLAFDVLLVDGFDMSGQPPQLCSEAFYEDAHRSLTPNGILVVNLCDWGYKVALRRIRAVFEDVLLCDCPDGTNRIAFARKYDMFNPSPQQLMERAKELSLLHPLDLDAVARQFASLAQNAGRGSQQAGPELLVDFT